MTKQQAYQSALDVQDACNLLGVIRSFVEAMDAVKDECSGTDDRNHHPIAVLYSSKIENLTGSFAMRSFSEAHDKVERMLKQYEKTETI